MKASIASQIEMNNKIWKNIIKPITMYNHIELTMVQYIYKSKT